MKKQYIHPKMAEHMPALKAYMINESEPEVTSNIGVKDHGDWADENAPSDASLGTERMSLW